MIDRRQFTKGTLTALAALRTSSLLGKAESAFSSQDVPLREFHLRDYLSLRDFQEELLSYPLTFAAGAAKKDDLRLFVKGSRNPLPIQFTGVDEKDGFLRSATLHFRTGLKMGDTKIFALLQSAETPAPDRQSFQMQKVGEHRLAIQANQLQILVPEGRDLSLNIPVSQAPAPLLALARENGKWVGAGRLKGPDSLIVQKMDARIEEQGPLFLKYAVTYSFNQGRSYTMTMTVQCNESHVEIDEFATALSPDEHLEFEFSYKQGVDPNGRLLMANGGYSTGGPQQGASGAYDEKADRSGMLPIKLGIYTPNSINLPRAIAFWNDSGENAILFALRKLPDWKTSQRALWSASSLPDNLVFFAEPGSGDKYVRAPIVGAARYWAIGLIPRNDLVLRGITMGQAEKTPRPPDNEWRVVSSMQGLLPYAAGPEVRLLQKLNDFSLNRYKELVFEFTEDSRTAAFKVPASDIQPTEMTCADYLRNYARCYVSLAQTGWDISGEMGANHWGWSASHPQTVNYVYNCRKWSAEERMKARSRLVFAAYLMELDTAMPQSSMLGGHPNFAAEYKQVLGVVAGLFPLHPHAARWRDTYVKFWDEYLDRYVRKADPETGALGGRHTESIACYNYASMEAICMAATGLKAFDGTQILDRPAMREWVRWDMESRLPFRVDGARVVPPEGAHAGTVAIAPGGRWYCTALDTARLLRDTAPSLANQWMWTITAGAEGRPPERLDSNVFVDFGPVFRYDFGGPNEAYLHMQQLNGPNYRWSTSTNGTLYFAAKGKVWSWNQTETNGDNLDVSQLSALQVGRNSLGASPEPGVLYNFGFAQYYRAAAHDEKNRSPYKARGVMMVRGDYIAVRDEVDDGAPGAFHWSNESSGLQCQIFRDTEFQQPHRSFVNDSRFPLQLGPDQIRDLLLPDGNFAIRSTGQILIPVAGRYRFSTNWNNPNRDVPGGDFVRFYLDEHKVFDGKGPGSGEMELEARPYAIRFEYIHASKEPPFLMFTCKGPESARFTQVDFSNFRTPNKMPFIAEVQGGPGKQLHIVAPEKLAVAPVAAGAAKIGGSEFVLFGDAAVKEPETNLTFRGRSGYASSSAVALFDGTHIEMNGLGLSKTEGQFGASAKQTNSKSIEGRIAGKSGGQLWIHLPAGFPAKSLVAKFDGRSVPVTIDGQKAGIQIAIKQSDGVKTYSIAAL